VSSVRKNYLAARRQAERFFVQAHLNAAIFLRNLVHLELVGTHLAKSIAQRLNPLQQFLAAALQQISRRNAGVEGVGKTIRKTLGRS